MPQENTVKETIKTVYLCSDGGDSGRLLCSFINDPTWTRRNVGNFHQLWKFSI